jgi:L1 cell adhesion molecule like protein
MLVPYVPPPQQQANDNANKMVVLYNGRNAANTSIPNSNDSKGMLATSLGVELADGKMHRVASRNTPLPAKITQTFSTADDNQTFAIIEVFEGEASNTKNNKALGAFQLDGIPPMPKRQPRILITFDIDERGRVSVSATEKTTGATSGMGFRAKRSRLQQVQPQGQQTRLQQVQPQGQQTRLQQVQPQGQQAARGRAQAQRNASRQAFNKYLDNAARAINTDVPQGKRDALEQAVLEESSWLENNPNASAEEYNSRLNQLKALVNASV